METDKLMQFYDKYDREQGRGAWYHTGSGMSFGEIMDVANALHVSVNHSEQD